MRVLAAAVLALALAACAPSRKAEGPALAQAAGWRWDIVSAGAFDLAVAVAPRPGDGTLTVYLEGDGLAYARPNQPAIDPTPTDPVALRLALADPTASAAAWIGRPCQYTLPERGRNCDRTYWTAGRYAPEVLDSIGTAVDAVKQRTGARRLILVGYSGGGALATLLAARRGDVARLVTVAANLDLDDWTRRLGVSPLGTSLNPVSVAGQLGTLPQTHFTGAEDRVVDTGVVRSFLRRLPQGAPARLIEVPQFSHGCCWARDWPALVSADR